MKKLLSPLIKYCKNGMLLIIIENTCYHYFKNDNILKMAEYQDNK